MESMISHLSQKICKRLREAGLFARTLTLTIRYAGFETYTRSKTVHDSVNLDTDIHTIFLDLFHDSSRAHAKGSASRHVAFRTYAMGRSNSIFSSRPPRKAGSSDQSRRSTSRQIRVSAPFSLVAPFVATILSPPTVSHRSIVPYSLILTDRQ